MASRLGWFAVVSMSAGPLLSWLRLVPALLGFGLFALGGITAVVASLGLLLRVVRGRGFPPSGFVAIAGTIVFGLLAAPSSDHPRINDFTTNLANPPRFEHAPTLPENAGRDFGYPRDFAVVQRACCEDLRPALIPTGLAETAARALRVARAMPHWKVTHTSTDGLTIEAVATTPLFGFHDDVAIRVSPGPGASQVDIRSRSRDGQGDFGANAARIRAFVSAMEERG